jgi:hypothetical protein
MKRLEDTLALTEDANVICKLLMIGYFITVPTIAAADPVDGHHSKYADSQG